MSRTQRDGPSSRGSVIWSPPVRTSNIVPPYFFFRAIQNAWKVENHRLCTMLEDQSYQYMAPKKELNILRQGRSVAAVVPQQGPKQWPTTAKVVAHIDRVKM